MARCVESVPQNKIAMVGLIMLGFFILIALLAPVIAPYEYDTQVLRDRLKAPSSDHWFGTDDLGRDLFTRVLYGARISLWVGTFSVVGSIILGTLFGILAGFYGKWIDMVISRLFDILLAFPSILLAIAIVAILGPVPAERVARHRHRQHSDVWPVGPGEGAQFENEEYITLRGPSE
ncbi:hypothetical protein HMSSN139_17180 [Paenibacillus sp. HMSSN-139]|nr:hypothetical protein HMSSN139_17180 [Paenibacillus sp. HMSSN-139]